MKDLNQKSLKLLVRKDNIPPGWGGEHYPRFSVEMCSRLMTTIMHNVQNKVPLNWGGSPSYAHALHVPLFLSALGRNKSSSLKYLWQVMGI